MASYLITGASRGIGLALAGILAAKPVSEVSIVYAAARTETDALKKLIAKSGGRVERVSIDVTSKERVEEAASQVELSLGGKGLDVLICSAGALNSTPGGIENMTELDSTFNTNVTGIHLVTAAFLPLLKKGNLKKVTNISSALGSMGMSSTYKDFPDIAYKISKAALNMLTVQYAHAFADQGFVFTAISPGTDMGGEGAHLIVNASANASLDIVFRSGKTDNGKFFNVFVPGWEKNEEVNRYDGAELSW